MERVEADRGARGVSTDRLGVGGPRSIDTASSASAAPSGNSPKNAFKVSVSFPALPRKSHRPDINQPRQPIRIQHIPQHPLTDRPNRAPPNSSECTDRRLIGSRGQPRHQLLEITREPRSRPRERHPLTAHAMLRARSRRRRTLIRYTRPQRSRCRHEEATSRVSYRYTVAYEHSGHTNSRRVNRT